MLIPNCFRTVRYFPHGDLEHHLVAAADREGVDDGSPRRVTGKTHERVRDVDGLLRLGRGGNGTRQEYAVARRANRDLRLRHRRSQGLGEHVRSRPTLTSSAAICRPSASITKMDVAPLSMPMTRTFRVERTTAFATLGLATKTSWRHGEVDNEGAADRQIEPSPDRFVGADREEDVISSFNPFASAGTDALARRQAIAEGGGSSAGGLGLTHHFTGACCETPRSG